MQSTVYSQTRIQSLNSPFPALYRGCTKAAEERVHDNLHAHARSEPIRKSVYWMFVCPVQIITGPDNQSKFQMFALYWWTTEVHLQPWSQGLENVILYAFCPSPPLYNADKTLSPIKSLHFAIFQHWKGEWGCWHLLCRYHGYDFMFLHIFQHNLSMVVGGGSILGSKFVWNRNIWLRDNIQT